MINQSTILNTQLDDISTFSPTFQFLLQFLDQDVETPTFFFLTFIFFLPFFRRQFQIQTNGVFDGFSSETHTHTHTYEPLRPVSLLSVYSDLLLYLCPNMRVDLVSVSL